MRTSDWVRDCRDLGKVLDWDEWIKRRKEEVIEAVRRAKVPDWVALSDELKLDRETRQEDEGPSRREDEAPTLEDLPQSHHSAHSDVLPHHNILPQLRDLRLDSRQRTRSRSFFNTARSTLSSPEPSSSLHKAIPRPKPSCRREKDRAAPRDQVHFNHFCDHAQVWLLDHPNLSIKTLIDNYSETDSYRSLVRLHVPVVLTVPLPIPQHVPFIT